MAGIKGKIPVGAKVSNKMYGDGEVVFVNIDFKSKQYTYLVDFGRHGEVTMTRDQLHYNPPVESE